MTNNDFDEELELDEDSEGLTELNFEGQHYLDVTSDDQDQDLRDYYSMVESGVDMTDEDPLDGFQIYNSIDDSDYQ